MNDIELTNEQLESVAGGSDTQDIKYNLNNYAYKTVTVTRTASTATSI